MERSYQSFAALLPSTLLLLLLSLLLLFGGTLRETVIIAARPSRYHAQRPKGRRHGGFPVRSTAPVRPSVGANAVAREHRE